MRHCRWVRLAAKRYLADRERAKDPASSFAFSPSQADNACDFIEKLPHVEGKWKDKDGEDAPDIILHPAHVFFIVNLFGFRQHDGTRRFTVALFSTARKNAKSTIAAAILLYCFCCEDEPGPQVISAATTGSQARIVFNIAKRMVEMTPDLRSEFSLEVFSNAVVNWDVGGNFRPINAKASTQDGLNPSHTCLDEIHAHKSSDLLNVLQSAAGARLNALWLYTTTEGYETPGPWPEMRQFAHQVLQGILEADHFFAIIFQLDEQIGDPHKPEEFRPKDEDFDESKWPKANPLMSVNPILAREIRKAAIEAKQMPSMHAEFRTKRLNRQSASANAWLNIERWKLCGGQVDLDAMVAYPCWAGLDGAATTDIMSFRLIWRDPAGVVYTWGKRWVPVDAVSQRTDRGTVPYAGWVAAGYIEQVPGKIIDYTIVEKQIVALCERFHPKSISYDAWNIRDLANKLAAKLPKVRDPKTNEEKPITQEFRQGPKSYHPAMTEAERLYLAGNLRHGNDPVFNWCMSNVVPRRDENMNMAPDRKHSADKIDDACAFYMAIGAMGTPVAGEERKYQLFFA